MAATRKARKGRNKTVKATGKRYETHDNGARPFSVVIRGNRITIYKQAWDGEHWTPAPKPLKECTFTHIWIAADRSAPGNTITAQLTPTTFLHVGSMVYLFELERGDIPVRYESRIGNSDVAYPFMVGKTHTYFLGESQGVGVMANTALHPREPPYGQFYMSPTKRFRPFKKLISKRAVS